jgi:nucleotide-binding universal stress UspA family protein
MYKQIVVGTDGSEGASLALGKAVDLARLTGADLHIVYAHKIANPFQVAAAVEAGMAPGAMLDTNDAVHAEGQRICDRAVEQARRAGVTAEGHCVGADPAEALSAVAQDVHADLIVVGNRGMSGARRFVLGSVPNKLSHHCPTSLLIADTSSARS